MREEFSVREKCWHLKSFTKMCIIFQFQSVFLYFLWLDCLFLVLIAYVPKCARMCVRVCVCAYYPYVRFKAETEFQEIKAQSEWQMYVELEIKNIYVS